MPRFKNYDDDVYTPPEMAEKIVEMLAPQGRLCDPAAGKGAFVDALRKRDLDADSFEIKQGRDFLAHDPADKRWDWIIANPPWSPMMDFFEKAMACADNVAFLVPLAKVFTTCRVRTLMGTGWQLQRVLLCDQPRAWGAKKTGFQLAVVHFRRDVDEPARAWAPTFERLEPLAA